MDRFKLTENDRVFLHGGYCSSPGPEWLRSSNKKGYYGTVISFIPGQYNGKAAVVRLDEQIALNKSDGWDVDITGNIVILELRYKRAKWERGNVVSIELCDFTPETESFEKRRKGMKIETHALYRKIN